jgi:hypothetical protein
MIWIYIGIVELPESTLAATNTVDDALMRPSGKGFLACIVPV